MMYKRITFNVLTGNVWLTRFIEQKTTLYHFVMGTVLYKENFLGLFMVK